MTARLLIGIVLTMKIRPITQKLKTTDYGACVAVHTGVLDNGAQQVVATLSTEDVYGFPEVLCHLKLSPAEAKALGEALVKAAASFGS